MEKITEIVLRVNEGWNDKKDDMREMRLERWKERDEIRKMKWEGWHERDEMMWEKRLESWKERWHERDKMMWEMILESWKERDDMREIRWCERWNNWVETSELK